MNARQIDRFFQTLSKQFEGRAVVILTGAAAGALWGRVRPSVDIDFAVQLVRAKDGDWERLERAMERTVRLTGINSNFAEDIDRWGQISLLDYRRHTHPYRKFSRIEVRLLDPEYWSIGKMTRYLDPDVRDLVEVFKRRKLSAERLADLWGRALRRSPRSAALQQFRRQVEHFIRSHGRSIWGSRFDEEAVLRRFRAAAGIA